VIIHADLAGTGGHYWSYVRERQGVGNAWVWMDDEKVQPWDFSCLEQDCFGDDNDPSAPSALILWYDRVSINDATEGNSTVNDSVVTSGKIVPNGKDCTTAACTQENSSWAAEVHATAARAQTLGSTPHVALMERLLLLSRNNEKDVVEADHAFSRSNTALRWLCVLLSHPHAPTRSVATRRACALLGEWNMSASLALLQSLVVDSGLADVSVHLLEACQFAGEVSVFYVHNFLNA